MNNWKEELKKIKIIEKGGKGMISSENTMKEYAAICNENISDTAKLVKISKLILKLLLGIRTNQRGGVRRFNKFNARPQTPQTQTQPSQAQKVASKEEKK